MTRFRPPGFVTEYLNKRARKKLVSQIKFPYDIDAPILPDDVKPELERLLPRLPDEPKFSAGVRMTREDLPEHKLYFSKEKRLGYSNYSKAQASLYKISEGEVKQGHVDELWKTLDSDWERVFQTYRVPKGATMRYRNNDGLYHPSSSFPLHEAIDVFMPKVFDILNSEDKGIHAIEKAILLHHMVVWLHPYPDGNNRLAMLLMKLKLMRSGFPLVAVDVDKKRYFETLNQAHGGNITPFAKLMAKGIISSAL